MEWIGELELDGNSYEFDLFRLEYDSETKRYRIGTDSGCSCPTPFEDGRGEFVDNLSFRQALALLDAEMASSTKRHMGWFCDSHYALRKALREHAERENIVGIY